MSNRVYPTCCTSAYCGKIDCTGCKNKPILDKFKAWVEANNAIVEDPIWCPTIYTPKTGDRNKFEPYLLKARD